MLKREYQLMVKKIQCSSAQAESDLIRLLDLVSDVAVSKTLKSLRCNSHKVINARLGESRRDNRKEMIFVDVENMNGMKMTYRMDLAKNGEVAEIMKNIKDGWRGVSTW